MAISLSAVSVGAIPQTCRYVNDSAHDEHMRMVVRGGGGIRGKVVDKMQQGKADLTDMSMLGWWKVLIGEWLILEWKH